MWLGQSAKEVIHQEQKLRVRRAVITNPVGIRLLIGVVGKNQSLCSGRPQMHRSHLASFEDRVGERRFVQESTG